MLPSDIARQFVQFAGHPYAQAPALVGEPPSEEAVKQILTLPRPAANVEFSNYKPSTIRRRIHRRMALRGLERVEDYAQQLKTDPVEVH